MLANLHLLERNGRLKNAALLLFAKDPLNFFTAVQFKIGRFGVDKSGFIESWGRGFKKIREGFEKAGMKLPVFEPHCGGVLVTIFRKEMTIAPPSNTPVTHQYPPSTPLVPHQYPPSTPPVVNLLINVMSEEYASIATLMQKMGIKDIKHFRETYLKPSVEAGLVEKEYPDNHPRQRYRLSKEGLDIKEKF